MTAADADHVLQQLRLIRAENEKRDREFALMRAEFAMFRSQLEVFGLKLDMIVSVLGTHTDTLHQMNDRLLALQRQREGEPGSE
jgi:hypothetical protein